MDPHRRYLATQALLARYADAVDRRQWNVLRSIFLEGASFDISDLGRGVLNGLDEILEYMRYRAIHPVAHLIANVHLMEQPPKGDDGSFFCRSRLLAVQSDGSVVVGTYEDKIAVLPDHELWIESRKFTYVRRASSSAAIVDPERT